MTSVNSRHEYLLIMPNYFRATILIFLYTFLWLKNPLFSQTNETIKFDLRKFALYSEMLDSNSRYTTIKSCTVNYKSKKKSGKFKLNSNYLTRKAIVTLNDLRTKEIELTFSNIVLADDSLKETENLVRDFKYTIYKKKIFRLNVGPTFIPWFIPDYYIIYDN
jgi:hypothetical protein